MEERPECKCILLTHVPQAIVNPNINYPRLFGNKISDDDEEAQNLIVKLPSRLHERTTRPIEKLSRL